jgi:hypothetical protein
MLRATFAAVLLCASAPAGAATIHARSGASATVADAAAGPLQCVIRGLEAVGYPIRFMGGWRRHGSVRGSLHPAGRALDINQVARGRTTPRMPKSEVSIAQACGAVSGAQWRNNDSGHFQVGGSPGRHHHKRRRR